MKCKRAYKEILMTGPFTKVPDLENDRYVPIPQSNTSTGKKKSSLGPIVQDVVKERERINVMGAIM
jgi:hypothetical protein